MKILFLLPPSEGKNSNNIANINNVELNTFQKEKLSFNFVNPLDIAITATQKDLKCQGKRYEQGVQLNQNIKEGTNISTIPAIHRYSGVMYRAIDFTGMNTIGSSFFQEHFLIFSGLYGILKPLDTIANYKLPIETKGLYQFWGDKISQALADENADYIVNLLPISYAKLIKNITNISSNGAKIININFLKPDGKKIAHGVKKIKGARIKNICEQGITNFKEFGGEIVESGKIIDINLHQSS